MGSQARLSRADRRWLTLLAVTAGAVIVAHLVGAHGARARSTLGFAALTLAFAVPAWAVLVPPRPEGRAQRRPLALVLSFGAIVFLGFLLHVLMWPTAIPFGGGSPADVALLARTRRQISRPSTSGSMRSSTSTSGGRAAIDASASRPFASRSTEKPDFSR